MKLVLACTAVVLLSSVVELAKPTWRERSSIDDIYRNANITPIPEQPLVASFGEHEITSGTEISPGHAREVPSIGFNYSLDCYYTFLTISPDWPTPNNPVLSPCIAGMYMNLYGDRDYGMVIENSCEVVSWRGPNPPPGTGSHRYLLYIYKQDGYIDTNKEAFFRLQIYRLLFPFDEFVETYNLVGPIAGCFFYSSYPLHCDA